MFKTLVREKSLNVGNVDVNILIYENNNNIRKLKKCKNAVQLDFALNKFKKNV